ncbi:glycosyltransferase [Lawsonia intracellularis]|uniref:glycosyltransferase n=1 Tax=Lawsonia intracellularis TaxID=29546 RepID=UPI00097552AA|nr:glycosyltransferase [Lawsonia intracellularis]OMQ01882.1 glycosyltransferase [Lawsonia intracellularis]
MHLLFVTHDIDSGGAARSLSILVQQLVKRHKISIITFVSPEPEKPTALLYQQLGVSLYLFPWGWLPVSFIGCEPNIEHHQELCSRQRKYLPEVKHIGETADVICFNSYAPTSLAPYFPGKRKVLIAREIIDTSDYHNYKKCTSMLKQYINFAIAIGPQESSQLQSMGIPHSIVYNSSSHIPYFEPFSSFPPTRFGMFAQFIPTKGLDILLLAYADQAVILKERNVHLHLFGINLNMPSKSTQAISDFIQSYKLTDFIHLEGWVNNVEQHMAAMHCMIRPDRTGSPWGRDIIEAMSIGRPTIASGEEDVFVKNGRTGYLFPPKNVKILGKILALLSEEPTVLEIMGKNAFEFAKDHFNPEINSTHIEHILLEEI